MRVFLSNEILCGISDISSGYISVGEILLRLQAMEDLGSLVSQIHKRDIEEKKVDLQGSKKLRSEPQDGR